MAVLYRNPSYSEVFYNEVEKLKCILIDFIMLLGLMLTVNNQEGIKGVSLKPSLSKLFLSHR